MNHTEQKIVIEVTGDLILDNNLAQLPQDLCTYSNPVQAASRKPRRGGAWYLADQLKHSCCDLENCELTRLPKLLKGKQDHYARAHTIWAVFAERQDKNNKKFVWRIREFLGCQKPEQNPAKETVATVEHPEIIVIDDANLGFRDDQSRWPAAIQNLSQESHLKIVLKHSPGLAQGALWRHLIKHFADRLTLVISLNALRDRHAVISKGISWDQSIEDLKKEFREGASAHDLGQARNVIVHIPGGGVACFSRDEQERTTRLKHLVFDPSHMEDDWKPRFPGMTFGAGSILTASMVRHLLQPETYPFFIAASRALSAIRQNHVIGAGQFNPQNSDHPFEEFDTDAAHAAIQSILHPEENSKQKPVFAENDYAAVVVDPKRYGLNCHHEEGSRCEDVAITESDCKIDLLQDVTGYNKGSLAAKAFEVVRDGVDAALRCVPKAKYGNFVTVDREEIERINELRGMIEAYCQNSADCKPLSLAVFGPPGSGKSFAIKQLARQLFPQNRAELEFNLSQFSEQHELTEAFHQVHNATVRGEIPFVFWDEFDTDKLKWLISFLAPMQDAVFRDAGIEHPFGKAIFIFAGGTCKSFKDFNRSRASEEEQRQFLESNKSTFKDLKGPDFVSRLRGYLNVKGPNQIKDEQGNCTEESEHVYLIRRAMLLRSLLERHAPEIIDPSTKMASISSGIVNAFIHVDEYLHGARSMEAVLTMGSLLGKRYYGPNSLPSTRSLALHVSEDFWKEKNAEGVMELMAKAGHDGWKEDKENKGYVYGDVRNDAPAEGEKKTHPLMKEYSDLEEREKRGNREPVPRRMIALQNEGYLLKQVPSTASQANQLDIINNKPLLQRLKKQEHNVWLRGHLVNGWEYSEKTNDKLRLHSDIRAYEDLEEGQQEINETIIVKTIEELRHAGYLLEPASKTQK